jgi:hypothetical protein
MAVRTVRLDEEAEEALKEIREVTRMPISEALKRGLHVLRSQVRQGADRRPFELYRGLDLGPGGYAIAPAADAKGAVKRAIEKKRRR